MMKRLATIEETKDGRWLVSRLEANEVVPDQAQAFVSWREAEEYAREWLMPDDNWNEQPESERDYEPDPDRDYDLDGGAAAEEAYRDILKGEQ